MIHRMHTAKMLRRFPNTLPEKTTYQENKNREMRCIDCRKQGKKLELPPMVRSGSGIKARTWFAQRFHAAKWWRRVERFSLPFVKTVTHESILNDFVLEAGLDCPNTLWRFCLCCTTARWVRILPAVAAPPHASDQAYCNILLCGEWVSVGASAKTPPFAKYWGCFGSSVVHESWP